MPEKLQRVALSLSVVALALVSTPIHTEESRSDAYFHFLMGSMASLDKDSKSALEHFRFAGHLNPNSQSIKLRQARELVEVGELEPAKEILDDVEKSNLDNSEFYVLRSRIASQELDADGAAKALDRAIVLFRAEQNDYKVRELVLTKVALLADFKKYNECVTTLQSYLKDEPGDEVAHYFLGKIHSIFQNRTEAKRAFKKALEIRSNFVTAYRALGLQYELDGQIDEAIKLYKDAIENGAGDEEIFQKLINLTLIEEDYPTALKFLTQYLSVRPDDGPSQMRAGLIHFKLKQYPEAKEIFRRLIGRPDVADDRVRFYLASVHEEIGEFNESSEQYLKVEASSDYYVEARMQAAYTLHHRLKRADQAIEVLREALKVKDDSSELVLALASHFDRTQKFQEGIELLTAATLKFKDNEKILFTLGVFEEKAGLDDQALATMKRVLQMNPNNPHALNHIGYTYVDRNESLDEAEMFLKKAVQLAPDNGFIMDSLGWLFHKRGKYQKAVEVLEKANKLAPGQVVILEHLADTYKKLGRNKEALAVYRQIMGWSSSAENSSRSSLMGEGSDAETRAVQDRVRTKIAAIDPSNQY